MERRFPYTDVRTRSVPTAGHLIALGYRPVTLRELDAPPTFVFSIDAERTLLAFQRSKAQANAYLELHGVVTEPRAC